MNRVCQLITLPRGYEDSQKPQWFGGVLFLIHAKKPPLAWIDERWIEHPLPAKEKAIA